MRKKNRQTTSNKKRQPWVDVFARTQRFRVSSETSQDWHADVPNIKLSRAFVIVLILHVVAVGGILAFEMFKPRSTEQSFTDSTVKIDGVLASESGQLDNQENPSPSLSEENSKGYERYIVRSGDTIRGIAESYKISRTELLAANRIDETHPLVRGRILLVPKSLLASGGRGEVVASVSGSDQGFFSISELTKPKGTTETHDEVGQPSESISEVAEEADGFHSLASVPPVDIDEVAPRAIAVSATSSVSQLRVLREIPVNALVSRNDVLSKVSSSHTISSGDTLYGIAGKYKVSVDSILELNPGVKPRTLGVGKMLRLP